MMFLLFILIFVQAQQDDLVEYAKQARFAQIQPDLNAKKISDVDIKTLNFYKNELTKIISSDLLLKAIANWNSMNFTAQEQFLRVTKLPEFIPVPVLTYYDLPIIHHYPINQLIREIKPFPVRVLSRRNYTDLEVQYIQEKQLVLEPVEVPYKIQVPIPIPKKQPIYDTIDKYIVNSGQDVHRLDDNKKPEEEQKKDDDTPKPEEKTKEPPEKINVIADLNGEIAKHQYTGGTYN